MTRTLPRLNAAEEAFAFQCRLAHQRGDRELGQFVRNFKFHPVRRWELDFAWPDLRVGLEIQGGVWIRGAHGRPSNIERDMEKHNALLDLGWRVWHFTPRQVKAGEACQHLERVLLCARRGEAIYVSPVRPAEAPRSGSLSLGFSSSEPPF